ncbi:MAG: glycosyltransferase 61 family protein [Polyangia bacterium]
MSESPREQSPMLAIDHPGYSRRTRWTLLPAKGILRKKLFRRPEISLQSLADRTWQIAPGRTVVACPAYFLPGQLERVTGAAYTDDPQREMIGGFEIKIPPVCGFLVKGAWLIDSVIYKGAAWEWLHVRSRRVPQFRVTNEVDRAAVYSTSAGNGFFGLWLTDDCTAYPLAANEGTPITTDQPASPHMLAYEEWLGMSPIRLHKAFLRELVMFDDFAQTQHKRDRFRALSKKLLSHVTAEPHPGVFILRRDSGKRRILYNEAELAEWLRVRRGFRIVDVTRDDVPTIVAACAGSRVVVGVEGSHLIHGIMVLQPGGAVLTLQPPNRFCSVIKRTTDPDHQHFGFVVGHAKQDGYRVDADEVERTLDLLPRPPY